ncbi:S9 family peptidase [Rossellomorea aquimaris]|uniref:S9 family peptidase n=1 Tax=Rossellomorea aquimaris TaxID=189382 RepID=UPI001CD6F8C0|nr:S9 family peptidase [Rossellomorea aquimaris]MCA1056436.1 S9 family peptidase [Rossellomorea aquimaris]
METKGIQIKDLYHIKALSDPRISPCGKEAVYIQTVMDEKKDDYVSHLYFFDLETGYKKQWTFGEERVSSPRWSPDGARVAFLSNRTGQMELYIMNRDGGEAERLTESRMGIGNPVWSPCGTKIACEVRLKKGEALKGQEDKGEGIKPFIVSSMKYKSDEKGFHDDRYSQLVMIELETKEMTRLTDDEHEYSLHAWSGANIAYSADFDEEKDFSFASSVYLLDTTTMDSMRITEGKGYYGAASFSPDGRHLAYIGNEREYENATQNEIYIYNLESQVSYSLTAAMDIPVGDYLNSDSIQGSSQTGIVWSTDNESMYFIASDSGNTILYYAHKDGAIYPALFEEEQHIYGFDFHPEDQSVLLAMSKPEEPGELYFLHVPSGRMQKMTDSNSPWLKDRELSTPEMIMFSGEDGTPLQGWVMKPVDFKEGVKYPLIVEIHGGPHTMYGNTFFHEMQVLAGKGYGVLYVNPRGSHGYGQGFVDAVRGDYGGGDYRDIMSAVDYALGEYEWIDVDRLGVTGGSYGGFMTNWIITRSDRFKAAVTQRSISNWISFYGVSDIGYYFSEWQMKCGMDDIETLWKHSPLAYVKNIDTPLLILHSEKDYRCPIEQAEQLYIALKRDGKQTRFVRFPESNHHLSRTGKPSLREARLQEIIDWFEEYL